MYQYSQAIGQACHLKCRPIPISPLDLNDFAHLNHFLTGGVPSQKRITTAVEYLANSEVRFDWLIYINFVFNW